MAKQYHVDIQQIQAAILHARQSKSAPTPTVNFDIAQLTVAICERLETIDSSIQDLIVSGGATRHSLEATE